MKLLDLGHASYHEPRYDEEYEGNQVGRIPRHVDRWRLPPQSASERCLRHAEEAFVRGLRKRKEVDGTENKSGSHNGSDGDSSLIDRTSSDDPQTGDHHRRHQQGKEHHSRDIGDLARHGIGECRLQHMVIHDQDAKRHQRHRVQQGIRLSRHLLMGANRSHGRSSS